MPAGDTMLRLGCVISLTQSYVEYGASPFPLTIFFVLHHVLDRLVYFHTAYVYYVYTKLNNV